MTHWHSAVLDHAQRSGVDLPAATIDELALHLEDLHTSARNDGASETEARAIALRALRESTFSNLRRHARRCTPPHATHADDTARASRERSFLVFTALRTAVRQFRHHPAFALVTVLVLGIGTAAATTVFTIVDSVILRPLPYAQPDRLVTLRDTNYERGLAHDPI